MLLRPKEYSHTGSMTNNTKKSNKLSCCRCCLRFLPISTWKSNWVCSKWQESISIRRYYCHLHFKDCKLNPEETLFLQAIHLRLTKKFMFHFWVQTCKLRITVINTENQNKAKKRKEEYCLKLFPYISILAQHKALAADGVDFWLSSRDNPPAVWLVDAY